MNLKSPYVIAGGVAALLVAGYFIRRSIAGNPVRNDAAGPRLPALPKLPDLKLPAVSGAAPNMPSMPSMPRMPSMQDIMAGKVPW